MVKCLQKGTQFEEHFCGLGQQESIPGKDEYFKITSYMLQTNRLKSVLQQESTTKDENFKTTAYMLQTNRLESICQQESITKDEQSRLVHICMLHANGQLFGVVRIYQKVFVSLKKPSLKTSCLNFMLMRIYYTKNVYSKTTTYKLRMNRLKLRQMRIYIQ